jgi:F-type H+-transporting ATPase subunit epsilon
MSQKLLNLTITRVDGPVFDGSVISVVVPSHAGQLELLANHEPLIAPLKAGILSLKHQDGGVETIELKMGTLEVSNNHATILM